MQQAFDRTIGSLSVSRETEERLSCLGGLLEKWSRNINLVGSSTQPAFWSRHVADSLQLYRLNPKAENWLDIGSGAGFPGLVVAIMLAESRSGWVDLVESNAKKAAFLRAAIAETGAHGRVHNHRVEALRGLLTTVDAISARAVADLDRLLGLAAPWMRASVPATGWFHKGRDYRREVDKARGRWQFDLVEHRSVVDGESVILQIDHLQPNDASHEDKPNVAPV